MIRSIILLVLLVSTVSFNQEIINITVTKSGEEFLVPSYNYDGSIYVSLKDLSITLDARYVYSVESNSVNIDLMDYTITATLKNPYLVVKSKPNDKTFTYQLPTSIHYFNDEVYVPLNPFIKILNKLSDEKIIIISPGKLVISKNAGYGENEIIEFNTKLNDDKTELNVKTIDRMKYSINRVDKNTYFIFIRNTTLLDNIKNRLKSIGLIDEINVENYGNDILLKINVSNPQTALDIVNIQEGTLVIFRFYIREDSEWYEKESKHFKVIYRKTHAHLVNHILSSAENALRKLKEVFSTSPTEKIIINTYDVSDYGFGATTTVPQDYVRLEIESFEPGYEALLYNERIQWLLSHELTHIIVNDQESDLETSFRSIFKKVPPDKTQPSTVLYSLLTNFTRYSPRWYQEGIAVFMETWLSGGYGRSLGNFDEMYFRTLVEEGKDFPSIWDIETNLTFKSIFLQNIFYFYGTRLASYLAIKYGAQKLIDWYKTYPNQNFEGFLGKFEDIFGLDFYTAWQDFAKTEFVFQKKNLETLNSAKLTPIHKISKINFGWVTQPYFDERTLSLIFGYHKSGHLATLQKFHLLTKESEDIVSLPTPSMLQVSSTAYDEGNNLFYFTTNNNRLFRDVWVVDLTTKKEKILFPDSRIGNLAVSPVTHDLWGIQQQGGISTLIVSPYPYNSIIPIMTFNFGEELSHLAVSKSGKKLAAVLHRPSGEQVLILFNTADLLSGNPVSYQTITNSGSPENPSWSKDEKTLYWNAYTNGVSNIYSYNLKDSTLTALSHCLTGLFKPIQISKDSLFAFEFSTDGFLPVMIPNKKAQFLPAIHYYGQKILDVNPQLVNWALKDADKEVNQKTFSDEKPYNPLANLHIHSFVPVISGFENQIMLGLFTHISDPLLIHDFTLETGISPFNETPSFPFFHLRLKYSYKQRYIIEYAYNAPDFFDLFNSRKRGMIGSRFKLQYDYYWLYDKPHTIKQATSLTFFRGVEFINDNLVRVSQPDFAVLVSNINSRNLRRSIGSSDYEFGDQVSLTLTLYSTKFEDPQFLFNGYLEYDRYLLWIAHHNVLHLKFAGGYMADNDEVIQGRFYFGGFGNRAVDNGMIRQYRKVFRFPGLPIYSLMTTKFFKFMFENTFPPIRVSGWHIGSQFINHINYSVYSQSLITKSEIGNFWVNLGAQLDIKFKHWFNLESTLSAGIAKAWSEKMNDWQWFISLKLLKN